jgi:hypothetical protein
MATNNYPQGALEQVATVSGLRFQVTVYSYPEVFAAGV